MLVLADNQEKGASLLDQENSAINLGSGKLFDYSSLATKLNSLMGDRQLREALSSRGVQLVDGYGVQRVIKALSRTNDTEKI